MVILQRAVVILICLLLSLGWNTDIGQSVRPEKGLYDFDVTLTLITSHLNWNSEFPMGDAIFNITITNTGVMPDDYGLESSCSSGWPAIASPTSEPLVTLPRDSFNVSLTVFAPFPRPGEGCNLRVIVQSRESPSKITKEKDILLVIHCPYLAVRSISILPKETLAGKTTSITATLMNAGDFYEPKANISFFIDGRPIALNVSAGFLGPGESKNITINWTAVEGQHTIEARTEHWFSDYENNSQSIKIHVGSRSLNGITEIGISSSIFIIIAFVLVMYWKKRKR